MTRTPLRRAALRITVGATGLLAALGTLDAPASAVPTQPPADLGLPAGHVVVWDFNGNDYPVPAVVSSDVVAMSLNYYGGLARKVDGSLVTFSPSGGSWTIPADVAAIDDVADFDAGDITALVLDGGTGAVHQWRVATTGATTVPSSAQSGVTAVASADTNLAVKDGGVIAWSSWDGSLRAVPAAAGAGVVDVGINRRTAVALKDDGTLVAWRPHDGTALTVPSGITDVAGVSVGDDDLGEAAVVARTRDGRVLTWEVRTGVVQSRLAGETIAQASIGLSETGVGLTTAGRVLGWADHGLTANIPTAVADAEVLQVDAHLVFGAALVVDTFPATVTAADATMTAGRAIPALTWSVNGRGLTALTTPPTCSTTATSASPAGQYPITCTGGAQPGFRVLHEAGTLSVLAPAGAVTVQARSATVPYGAAPTGAAYTLSGPGASSLTTAPTCRVLGGGRTVGTHVRRCSGAVGPGTVSYRDGRVRVVRAATQITTAPVSRGRVHPTATLVRVHDGQPLAGKFVHFSLRGSDVCTAVADAAGVARCDRSVVADGPLRATFLGGPRHLRSTDTEAPASRG